MICHSPHESSSLLISEALVDCTRSTTFSLWEVVGIIRNIVKTSYHKSKSSDPVLGRTNFLTSMDMGHFNTLSDQSLHRY